VSAANSEGRTIWIADAHRDNGKRFVAVASANRSTPCRNARMAGRGIQCPDCHKAPPAQCRDAQTQRAGVAPPHAEGDASSGVTSAGEANAFNSVPASFVGGVPVTRAMNPWAMPEAST
jgi:hypothetical protein